MSSMGRVGRLSLVALAPVLAAALSACGRIYFDEHEPADADATGGATGFTSLRVYGDTSCALLAGDAYCWGNNQSGQLGDTTTLDAPAPRRVSLLGRAVAIAPGDSHGCAIVDNGDVYCFGNTYAPTPAQVSLPAPATAIGAGNNFTCAIAGAVYCWGSNTQGQCGNGTAGPPEPTPVSVAFTGGYAAAELHVGDDHACALAPSMLARCWGHNDDGAIGNGSTTPQVVMQPTEVTVGVRTLPHIAGWHACALADGSTIECWGRGVDGELGDGLATSSAIAVTVAGLENVSAFETGGGPTDYDASCAIVGGNISCWGRGENGRLGTGTTSNQPTPAAVLGLPGPAVSVGVGYGHACALLADGDIWCWGRGDRGQLGDGNTTSSLAPVKALRPPS